MTTRHINGINALTFAYVTDLPLQLTDILIEIRDRKHNKRTENVKHGKEKEKSIGEISKCLYGTLNTTHYPIIAASIFELI